MKPQKFTHLLLILMLALGLNACGDPKIDATSKETLEASMTEVKNSLPEAERPKFEAAIQTLGQVVVGDIMKQALAGQTDVDALQAAAEKKVQEALNGKTGEEIIAEAERIRTDKK